MDGSFRSASHKLLEHYGFELSHEVIRTLTLKQAQRVNLVPSSEQTGKGVKQLIAECDGGMLPIVETGQNPGCADNRRVRKLSWKEARLCLAREKNSVTSHFRATMKSIDVVGNLWVDCAIAAGLGSQSKVHCIGDGAAWIKEQAEKAFGTQGDYLVDFYHASDYLAAAAPFFNAENPQNWMREQQARLKAGDLYLVLQQLEGHLYRDPCKEEELVRSCYRYLTNRLTQLDYLGAIENDLPIGSGEIESAHRHVVQKRMKKPGGWWKSENAEAMLQLLSLRSSGQWEKHWVSSGLSNLEKAA